MHVYDFFYDAQMKRYLQQVIAAFSGFKYQTGRMINGALEERIVPCRAATSNRMVANLLRNASENTLLTVPMITVARTALRRNQEMDRNHTFTEMITVRERAKDQNGKYLNEAGDSYTVERLMGVPFELTFQIDIWTSNQEQKDQLLEQILIIAGREVDIQKSDNPLENSSLTQLKLTDVNWSSRSVQVGTEDEIDVATLTYTMSFMLDPPAKVHRTARIQEVRVNVDIDNSDEGPTPNGNGDFVRFSATPEDYHVAIQRGKITLLTAEQGIAEWSALSEVYRKPLTYGVSELRLRKVGNPDGAEIVGLLYQNADPSILDWQIDPDTLPSNTLAPVDAIVRPLNSAPGIGLPPAADGQRYIIYDDISTSQSWGTVNAKKNDIIQYSNGTWVVVSEAANMGTETLVNLSTSTQLTFNEGGWEKTIDGEYGPGYFRIVF